MILSTLLIALFVIVSKIVFFGKNLLNRDKVFSTVAFSQL